MNQTAPWKVVVIVVAIVLGTLAFLPNLYGENPALQISTTYAGKVDQALQVKIENILEDASVPFEKSEITKNVIQVTFKDENTQIGAQDALQEALGNQFVVALNLTPATPNWLASLGLTPMKLGLDLRGGVHFLMEVDIDSAVEHRLEQFADDVKKSLRDERIRYTKVFYNKTSKQLEINLKKQEDFEKAYPLLRREYAEAAFVLEGNKITAQLTEQTVKEIQDYAIQQNIITLRSRTNELGVAEPIVQRQGKDRIVIELPGIQDTAAAKRILGRTATVELHAVDEDGSVESALAGYVPPGSKVYRWRDGRPELLKKRVIISGDHITGAVSGFDEYNQPLVNINLDSIGGKKFSDFTGKNINKLLSVVFVEYKMNATVKNGQTIKTQQKVENVINVATIRSKLGRRFRIEGMDSVEEARELALLLRAGSLAAPIHIVEERTVGPSLGQDNIDKGVLSIQLGLLFVLIFMLIYYKLFGLVANFALGLNLIFIVALLSLIPGATLTLPGIAGIVLTVGMAVDANVLIFQRIREELANGNTPQSSISAGYDKAFSTIADANITTLLAAIVLFAVGTGPIKGFAVTLSLGIVTSMFTAIVFTRMVVNYIYGNKRHIAKLSI